MIADTKELLESLTSAIDQVVLGIFADLTAGVADVEQLWRVEAVDGRIATASLSRLRPGILSRLDSHPDFNGTGFVAAPEALLDAQRYQEWWRQGPGGEPRFLSVQTGSSTGEVYDYSHMSWFTGAREGRNSVHGPYMDLAGSDRYVLTFAVPVNVDGCFIGVNAADVPVSLFEPLVLKKLAGSKMEVVIINPENRVVASSSADYSPGERARIPASIARPIGGPGVNWRICQSNEPRS